MLLHAVSYPWVEMTTGHYITSKFGRFTTDVKLRRIFGQDVTSFSFDDILHRGKIFLVKLGRGRCGTVVSRLLVSQLVARLKIAAMKRGSIMEKDRKDFFLYIDEAGLIPPSSVGDLLSEARKYRLGVVLSTQYTKQLGSQISTTRKDTLLDSVIGRPGSILISVEGYSSFGYSSASTSMALYRP